MMSDDAPASPQAWLKRARGNLAIAENAVSIQDVFLEDLCFNAQQAAEKALKAVCLQRGVDFPKTHSLVRLIDILKGAGVAIPPSIQAVDFLTQYAVGPRYPGVAETVTYEEYQQALKHAHDAFAWAVEVIAAQ